MLKSAGMKKVNFSGGEPFIVQKGYFLGEMVRYCKEDLDVESVTVVTNGSKVTRKWMEDYGYYLDIMAVSCDSFDEATNDKIGRCAKVAFSQANHKLNSIYLFWPFIRANMTIWRLLGASGTGAKSSTSSSN